MTETLITQEDLSSPEVEASFISPVAEAAHDMVGTFHTLQGKGDIKAWTALPEDVKAAWEVIIRTLCTNPNAHPEELHTAWKAFKEEGGWTLGPKDFEAKTNPKLVPYEELDAASRYKYAICKIVFETFTSGWLSFSEDEVAE